jgi:hypothetical protein
VKIVYLVQSHRNPGQVLRLVRALREGPSAHVLVRHDQRRSRLYADEVDAAGGTLVEDRVEVEWAQWSYVEVMLAFLRRAAQLAPDWTLVLSGQDYPLRPPAEIEARLAETEADALLGSVRTIDAVRPPAGEEDEFFLRTAYHHFRRPRRLPHLPRAVRPLIYVRDLPPLVGIRRPRPIRAVTRRPDLRLYASSDWLTLGRRGLEALLAAADDRALMRAFRRVAVPSESLFATVLLGDETLTVERDNRRFVPFPSPGSPHPATLTAADLEAALASGADFGRKFDARVDGRVLDLLDARRRSARPR